MAHFMTSSHHLSCRNEGLDGSKMGRCYASGVLHAQIHNKIKIENIPRDPFSLPLCRTSKAHREPSDLQPSKH